MSSDTCQDLLLSSLTEYYNNHPENKIILKEIIEGKHKLSLRLIDWLVTHYAKTHNTFYWIHKSLEDIYESYPEHIIDSQESKLIKKINLYLDYRAQLKSYAKINFDSFRRHNRITFFLDLNTNDFIETTVGQLNFFRWAFNNNIIIYALQYYDNIYHDMIQNNSYNKKKQETTQHHNIQDITKTMCILRFD